MNKVKLTKYLNIGCFILWLSILLGVIFAPSTMNLKGTCITSIALVLMRIGFDISDCKVIK